TDEELTAGALWYHVERMVWWTTSRDGGTDVEDRVIDRLPELPALDAIEERTSGLAGLISDLRTREGPPITPALVAMPFITVQRIDSENGELFFRELWYDGTAEDGRL